MSEGTAVTTVRIPVEQMAEVELVARTLRVTASQIVRDALTMYLREVADESFRARLRERLDEDRAILARLGGEPQ